MKNKVLYLVVGIPVAAVLMGIVSLTIAFSQPDARIPVERPPMSKSSWQE